MKRGVPPLDTPMTVALHFFADGIQNMIKSYSKQPTNIFVQLEIDAKNNCRPEQFVN